MPLKSDVSLYQSILCDGHLQHTCGCPSPLLGTLMTCIQPAVYQHHVFSSAKLSSTLLSSSPHSCEELFCHRCTSLHFPLLICQLRSLWVASIPPAHEFPLHSFQPGVVHALPEGSLEVVDEDTKWYWLQCWPWEMALIAGLPHFRLLSSLLWARQWLWATFQPISSQFFSV